MTRGMLTLALGGLLLGACGDPGAPTSQVPGATVAPPPTPAATTRVSPTPSASPTAQVTAAPTPRPERRVEAGKPAWVDVAVATGWRTPGVVRERHPASFEREAH